MTISERYERAYRDALDADREFQRQLERVYGKDASDARYWMEHDDAAVIDARAKFRAAAETLRAETETLRAENEHQQKQGTE